VSGSPVLFLAGMKRGDPRRRLDVLREIFVALQANCHPNLGLSAGGGSFESGFRNRPGYAQDVAFAAHRHALAESDLGGHAQGEFDLGTLGERRIGKEEDSPGTEILRESDTFDAVC